MPRRRRKSKPKKKRGFKHRSIAIPRHRQTGPTYWPLRQLGSHYVYGRLSTTVWFPTNSTTYLREKRECDDFNHGAPPYVRGDSFFLKQRSQDPGYSDNMVLENGAYKYEGCFAINTGNDPYVSQYNAYSPTASSYGAQAWKCARPVKPGASLAQFFGELKDLPSMVKIFAPKGVHDLGGLYLNAQFGWRPFVRDLVKIRNTMIRLEQRIAFVRKNNGKWLVRQGVLRDQTTTTTNTSNNCISPVLVAPFYQGGVTTKGTVTTTVTDKIWYKGRMKYYIPDLHVDKTESVWTSPLLRKMLGFELSPALAWELLPWSWFQDWFANFGDIFENFSNQLYDNLVAKYFFVMRHRRTETQWYQRQPFVVNGGASKSVTVRAFSSVECKERMGASQWGFGGGEDSFSTFQLLILAALGIQTVKIK